MNRRISITAKKDTLDAMSKLKAKDPSINYSDMVKAGLNKCNLINYLDIPEELSPKKKKTIMAPTTIYMTQEDVDDIKELATKYQVSINKMVQILIIEAAK